LVILEETKKKKDKRNSVFIVVNYCIFFAKTFKNVVFPAPEAPSKAFSPFEKDPFRFLRIFLLVEC